MTNGKVKPGTRKVRVGALGGVAATIIVWLLRATLDVEMPVEVATALGTLVTAIFVYLTKETYT